MTSIVSTRVFPQNSLFPRQCYNRLTASVTVCQKSFDTCSFRLTNRKYPSLLCQPKKLAFEASASSSSAEYNNSDVPSSEAVDAPEKASRTVFVIQAVSAIILVGTLVAAGITVAQGGPAALADSVTKSGFAAAFTLIFMSEIGDKTFFIAAIMAMTHSKYLVLAGASAALALMSVISVVIGRLFQKVPAQLQTTVPVGEYLAIALLLWFGIRNIRDAFSASPAGADSESSEEEGGELAEAKEFVSKAGVEKLNSPWDVFREAFTLVFVAEWGDRSMLATIALATAQSPVGVALGASVGHVIATGMAVMGGSLMAKYISERAVSLASGILFVAFAIATYFGVF